MKKLLVIAVVAAATAFAGAPTTDGTAVLAPEPATIGLMGAGLVAFGFAAWRKNRKR